MLRKHACGVCVRACMRVCVSPSVHVWYAVDSIYQPLTVAWAGVLLVWQPLPPPSPPPAPQPRPPHSPPLHPLQFQPTASCPTTHAQCKGDKDTIHTLVTAEVEYYYYTYILLWHTCLPPAIHTCSTHYSISMYVHMHVCTYILILCSSLTESHSVLPQKTQAH